MTSTAQVGSCVRARSEGEAETRLPNAAPRAPAVAAAAIVAACLVWAAGGGEPLPAIGWAAAFLFVAIVQDVQYLRIPNWLTFPSLLLAVVLAGVNGGMAGVGSALIGAVAALGVLFLPFAFGWLGAGDVKAAMVLGALWRIEAFLPALWWMIVAGGVLAIGLVAARGQLLDLLRRWTRSAVVTLRTMHLTYYGPPAGEAGAGLPFAVAMGLGAVAYQIWGMPWA